MINFTNKRVLVDFVKDNIVDYNNNLSNFKKSVDKALFMAFANGFIND